LSYILAAFALAFSLLIWMGLSLRTAQAALLPAGSTYTVDSTADLPDADPGDGICADAAGKCTLRAAIIQANFVTGVDTITLPSGVYLLTRPGEDDAAVLGDLDITDDVTIQGAGPGSTIIDGNGAVTGDRVFQIISSAKDTSFSGMTVRNGKKVTNAFDEGGGIYWDGGGGHLRLTDMVVEDNAARYGGGLFLNYSSSGDSVVIDQVSVHANTAAAAAGGLGVNFGDFASFDLRGSQVYSNTAYEGGGIYFQGTPTYGLLSVRIENSETYSNVASLSAGFENRSGDATVPVVVLNSDLSHNHAGYYGGAVGNYGTLAIFTTTLEANSAGVRGGGVYNYEGGQLDIEQSTLSGNSAQSGGGIYSEFFIHNNAALALTNSTLSRNTASQNGGGIYAVGGQIKLFSATIADNHVEVPTGTLYDGLGGGVYITATAVVTAQNTLIADNTHRFQTLSPVPDDCFGTVQSLGFNLIETTTHCIISGNPIGNLTGQDPMLGTLRDNGGSTQTQAPLPGSPAIDAGQDPICTDDTGSALTTDQRGFPRMVGARCDIGALEAQPDLEIRQRITPPEASPGTPVSISLVFSDTGSLPASGVIITDILPVEIQPIAVLSQGVVITDTGLAPPYVWQVQDLAYAQSGVITITGVVQGDASFNVITNTATIGSNPMDANPLNNRAEAVLKIRAGEKVYLPLVIR
jgi:CSLREA domain-containing protein